MRKIIKSNIAKNVLTSLLTLSILLSMCPANVEARMSQSANGQTAVVLRSFENGENEGDCTYVRVKQGTNKSVHIVIDAGKKDCIAMENCMTNLKSTDAYVNSTKTYTIDHFVITHAHGDHYNGLNYLTDTLSKNSKIIIKNLYVNLVYINEGSLRPLLIKLLNNSNITINNLRTFGTRGTSHSTFFKNSDDRAKINGQPIKYTFSLNQWSELNTKCVARKTSLIYQNAVYNVSLTGGCSMAILPALTVFNNYEVTNAQLADDKNYNYIDYNDSSMAAIIYDSNYVNRANETADFKAVFPGDMEAKALEAVYTDPLYNEYFAKTNSYGVTFSTIYYKVSHHGKRTEDYRNGTTPFYRAELQLMRHLQPTYVIGTGWKSSSSNEVLPIWSPTKPTDPGAIPYYNYGALLNTLRWTYGITTNSRTMF